MEKIYEEEFLRRFNQRKDRDEFQYNNDYTGWNKHIHLKHLKCGHEWDVTPYSLCIKNSGCPKCFHKNNGKLKRISEEETLKKLSDSHKGIPIKEETKIKLSEGSPKKKEVVQIDPNDNSIVAIFCSMVEAEKVTGISYTSISKCCNNKLKLAGGFQWKYKKDYEQEP